MNESTRRKVKTAAAVTTAAVLGVAIGHQATKPKVAKQTKQTYKEPRLIRVGGLPIPPGPPM